MKRLTSLILLLLCTACTMVLRAQNYEPVARKAAIVESGNMRFTVLTPKLIRIEYSPSRQFEDRATFGIVNRNLPVPKFSQKVENGYLLITTSALRLRYKLGTVPSTKNVNSNDLTITLRLNGRDVVWYPGKDDAMNLLGTTRTLDNCAGDSKRGELEKGILSRAGWAIADESPATRRGDGSTTFAFEGKVDDIAWLSKQQNQDNLDWYFFGYGHNYKEALGDFIKVAGRIPMPPLYIFGYWYSKYQKYTQQDFMDLVTAMNTNQIPRDVMIFDMDWHRSDHWTGWSWDRTKIPDPVGLINWMHQQQMKVAMNLHPADGINDYEDGFKGMLADLNLPSTTKNIPWQLEDSTFYRSFFKNILRPHEAEGVDFWWLDWQQYLTSKITPGLSETFWCNHVFYNDMRVNRPDRRPFIYHRWGGLGSHRYPIGFSGDTNSQWGALAFEPYFTATASNVGFGYWGHDLGGHQFNEKWNNNPELMLRWMQYGIFSPVFRTHASNNPELDRRIWMYPNFPDLRETVRLRYALIPYIYSAVRECYDTGVSICRPLYYNWPEEGNAYSFENEYMFGDDILVSPIVRQAGANGKVEQQTWLPEGGWFDVCRNMLRQGKQVISDSYTLKEIPYFYRAGSIIPNNPPMMNLKTQPEELVLTVVPGADGTGYLYEDEGDTPDYEKGVYATTTFSQKRGGNGVALTINARTGRYPGMLTSRSYVVKFLGMERPQSVKVNGKTASWDYDSVNHIVTVRTAKLPCDAKTVIKLQNAK